jgi:hypothetical protein
MTRDVIVAQLVTATATVFYAAVFAIVYYKDLGREVYQTEWRIKPLLYEGNRPVPRHNTGRIWNDSYSPWRRSLSA